MCSADDKQGGKIFHPVMKSLHRNHIFHIHTHPHQCISESLLSGVPSAGWVGRPRREEGGGSNVMTASVRRACQTGALSPHVRLSDLCDHLTGLLQRLDTGR